MKTAENLFKDWSGSSYQYEALSSIEKQRWVSFAVIYNNRQLDALKEGMKRAAEIQRETNISSQRPQETGESYLIRIAHTVNEAILTAAEQLTEKDL